MKRILFFATAGLLLSLQAPAQLLHQWSRAVGNTGDDKGKCVTYQEQNTVISAGTFNGTVDFDASPFSTANLVASGANNDMYIMMYNSIGNFMWVRQIGGSGIEIPESIIVDATGNIYVCGRFKGTTDFNFGGIPAATAVSAGGDDIFIAKYSNTGVFAWIRKMGNAGDDQGWDLSLDGSGNILFCGSYTGNVSFNTTAGKLTLKSVAGSTDAFYSRWNTAGTALWVKSIGGPLEDIAYGICPDPGTGAAYVCGTFGGTADFDPAGPVVNLVSSGGKDLFVGKYAIASGNYGWANAAGCSASDDIAQDISFYGNGVYFTGYLGAGTTNMGALNYTNAGPGTDAYLASYTVLGAPLFLIGFPGSTGDDAGQDICTDQLGYIYASGYFTNTVDFDPLGATYPIASAGGTDFFVIRYNTGGTFKTADGFGSAGSEECPGIAAHYNLKFLYITGSFSNTVDFDPVGTMNWASAGALDIFLARYNWTAPLRMAAADDNAIRPYPNPTSGTLYLDHLAEGTVAEVYTADGKKAGAWTSNGDRLAIELGELENGVYLLRVVDADGKFTTEKIVVQH